VTIKFFKNKLFYVPKQGKFIVFEKLDCHLPEIIDIIPTLRIKNFGKLII
jgi:hypothetical protein